MVKLCPLVLVFVSAIQIRGTNIMLNKPTVQSSDWSADSPSSNANDGSKDNSPSDTLHEQNPYWQGDLMGFYVVQRIAVTSYPGYRAVFDKIMLKKVSTPITSLTVSGVTGCGTMCHRTQPCLTFSYSPFLQPNCLLATDTAMTLDVKWVGYKIKKCFPPLTCNLSGFLQ